MCNNYFIQNHDNQNALQVNEYNVYENIMMMMTMVNHMKY